MEKKAKAVKVEDLDLGSIDPQSPVPLYYQVEADLRRLIREGHLPPGVMMPPEQDLCKEYEVSRHTVREALSRLVHEDLISRSAGRGTFVKALTDRKKFYLDRSFTKQMAEMGRTARSEVLESSIDEIGEADPAFLQGKQGAKCFRLLRLRFGDDEPIGIQQSTVVTSLCPGIEDYDFSEESLYNILSQEYSLVIAEIQHTISARVADVRQASLLQINEGDPLLVVSTSALLDNEEVIEYTNSFYRADRYEYSTVHNY